MRLTYVRIVLLMSLLAVLGWTELSAEEFGCSNSVCAGGYFCEGTWYESSGCSVYCYDGEVEPVGWAHCEAIG